MSFILDALRKSENERVRGSGPALLESRVVPRRRGVPLWAVIVGVILLANLAVLSVVLLRRPGNGAPAAASADSAPAAAPGTAAPAPAPAASAPPPQGAAGTPGYAQPGGYVPPGYAPPGYAQPGYAPPAYAQPGAPQPGYAPPGYPPAGYPAQPGYPPPTGYVPPPGYPAPPGWPQAGVPPQGSPQGYPPGGAAGAAPAADASGNAGNPPGATLVNPADYQPARPPARPAPGTATSASNALPGDAQLPAAGDLTAAGTGLPEQRLALHAYDADPNGRFVLLNSQRLREGETSSEGVRIERITPEGAVATWRGQRFRLTPGE